MIVEATYTPQEEQVTPPEPVAEGEQPVEATTEQLEAGSDSNQSTPPEDASEGQPTDQESTDQEPATTPASQTTESGSAQPENKTPKETPFKRIKELRKKAEKGEVVLPEGVSGLVGLMEKFGVITSAERAEELMMMDRDKLKQQDEYLKFKILDETQHSQQPYESDVVGRFLPQLKELRSKPEYQGKTTSEVLDLMMDEEKKQFYEKLKANSEQGADGDENSLSDAEIAEEAESQAKSKRDEFMAAAAELFGEFLEDSIKSSSFTTFLDNFFSVASARSNTTMRSIERGQKGENISLFEVEQHFRNKKEVVKALHFTYQNFVKVGSVLASQIPPEIRNIEQYQQVTKEQLLQIIKDLVRVLKDKREYGAYVLFERGVAESMSKPIENATVDDRVYLWMKEMSERGEVYERFWNNFKDSNTHAPQTQPKAA